VERGSDLVSDAGGEFGGRLVSEGDAEDPLGGRAGGHPFGDQAHEGECLSGTGTGIDAQRAGRGGKNCQLFGREDDGHGTNASRPSGHWSQSVRTGQRSHAFDGVAGNVSVRIPAEAAAIRSVTTGRFSITKATLLNLRVRLRGYQSSAT